MKVLIETIILALGLGLVLITLSGDTQRTAIWISGASVVLYLVAGYLKEDDDKHQND